MADGSLPSDGAVSPSEDAGKTDSQAQGSEAGRARQVEDCDDSARILVNKRFRKAATDSSKVGTATR
jgi:hypothetical protein